MLKRVGERAVAATHKARSAQIVFGQRRDESTLGLNHLGAERFKRVGSWIIGGREITLVRPIEPKLKPPPFADDDMKKRAAHRAKARAQFTDEELSG